MWARREFRFDRFRERMFERGDLKYVILELLREKPSHGYEIIRALEERFGGFYSPSPGAVYPTLQMLEEMGYVSPTQQDGKKVFAITDAGRAFLNERKPAVDEMWERMRGRWDPDLGREMHRLMTELRELGRSFVSETRRRVPDQDRMRRIRDVVRRAKSEIEAILTEEQPTRV